MNTKYKARAPLRLGLGGGGSDVPPFSDMYGGCVLNGTISLFAYAILEPLSTGEVIFNAPDLECYEAFDSLGDIYDDEPLRLHKGVVARLRASNLIPDTASFRLTTYSDAPPGSGLGTSSTMVVCIIQVFAEWLGLPLGEYDIADLAYRVEREDLGLLGGKQDQYAAAFGGFNFIEFSDSRVLVNPLRVKPSIIRELEQATLLFYTGKSRESAAIIAEQIKESANPQSNSTQALHKIKESAIALKAALLVGDLECFAKIIGESWEQKKLLSPVVSTGPLNEIYEEVMRAGGVSGKISGAGGGGFFMFIVDPERRPEVIRTLSKFSGEVIPFNFEAAGSISWVTRA